LSFKVLPVVSKGLLASEEISLFEIALMIKLLWSLSMYMFSLIGALIVIFGPWVSRVNVLTFITDCSEEPLTDTLTVYEPSLLPSDTEPPNNESNGLIITPEKL